MRPVAIFEEMLRGHPDLSPGIHRTLERCMGYAVAAISLPVRHRGGDAQAGPPARGAEGHDPPAAPARTYPLTF